MFKNKRNFRHINETSIKITIKFNSVWLVGEENSFRTLTFQTKSAVPKIVRIILIHISFFSLQIVIHWNCYYWFAKQTFGSFNRLILVKNLFVFWFCFFENKIESYSASVSKWCILMWTWKTMKSHINSLVYLQLYFPQIHHLNFFQQLFLSIDFIDSLIDCMHFTFNSKSESLFPHPLIINWFFHHFYSFSFGSTTWNDYYSFSEKVKKKKSIIASHTIIKEKNMCTVEVGVGN